MARGVTIGNLSIASANIEAGSIKAGYENIDVGGGAIPNIRNAAPMKIEFTAILDGTLTPAIILGAASAAGAECSADVTATDIDGNVFEIEDASTQVALEGDGAMTAKVTCKGNVPAA